MRCEPAPSPAVGVRLPPGIPYHSAFDALLMPSGDFDPNPRRGELRDLQELQ
jgi:hypothetical protein